MQALDSPPQLCPLGEPVDLCGANGVEFLGDVDDRGEEKLDQQEQTRGKQQPLRLWDRGNRITRA